MHLKITGEEGQSVTLVATDFSVYDLVVLTKISFVIDGESKEIASHYFSNH